MDGDDPMTKHRILFPFCRFTQGREVGNTPLGKPMKDQGNGTHGGPNAKWNRLRFELRPKTQTNSPPNKNNHDIPVHIRPNYPQYAVLEDRLSTFRNWLPTSKQKPIPLARAGFCYIGISDQVRCFYCGGELKEWQSKDNPWVEHARWFPKCIFLRTVKGDNFISKCTMG